MDKERVVLEKLLPELASFLEIIDHEPLGTTARRKQQLIQTFIRQIRTAPGEDEEYMYMNSIGLLNEASLVQETRKNNEVCGGNPPGVLPRKPQLPLPEIPELPVVGFDNSPASSADDHYEEANPLHIDTVPQYICSARGKSQTLPSNGLCGFYKDGNYMHSSIFTAQRDNDSDPQSSSYESYEEEEEDEKEQRTPFQWPSPEASLGLVQGSQICAFLLRKKRFGQWAKQLCVVRGDRLLCYKNSRKKNPQLDFLLPGCTVGYLVKSGRRKSTHELRIVRPGSDAVVLSVQSHEQAEQWCKILQDVCSQDSSAMDSCNSAMRMKEELEARNSLERVTSDGESIATMSSNEGAPSDGDAKEISQHSLVDAKNPNVSFEKSIRTIADTMATLQIATLRWDNGGH
uniref:actin filament-associated protein 1-like 1 n=1 Tax=Myxine glutinosa TaxID=7769 RepID=UPI00358EB247